MQTFRIKTHPSKHPAARAAFGHAARCVALFTMLILAACETPSEIVPEAQGAQDAAYYGLRAEKSAPSVVAVNPDGSIVPINADEEAVMLGAESGRGLSLVIAGRTTYSSGNVSMLRLSVRRTPDGTVSGGGAATIFGAEVGLTAECIKPITSFGRTYYGVNVEFSEPVVRTTPWGTVTYTHGAISVADGGDLANLVMGGGSGCYAAALLYPYEPDAGRINVVVPKS